MAKTPKALQDPKAAAARKSTSTQKRNGAKAKKSGRKTK